MPRIIKEAAEYWKTYKETDDLVRKLIIRRDMDTPIVVDQQNSLVIPLILDLDPNATFIWLLREPVGTIRSSLKSGMYGGGGGDWEEYRLTPHDGFLPNQTQFSKICWRYMAYNLTAEEELERVANDRWQLWKAEELDGWAPRSDDELAGLLSENDIYRIEQNVRPYYEQWLSRP
jgi:hypothetical protein